MIRAEALLVKLVKLVDCIRCYVAGQTAPGPTASVLKPPLLTALIIILVRDRGRSMNC